MFGSDILLTKNMEIYRCHVSVMGDFRPLFQGNIIK